MDEPPSNLDAKLRVAMRTEIGDLQRRLKRTILFVTHDQEEAMSIADTIYLFNEGQVLQKGPPRGLYENPKTRYAAEFLGRANIIAQHEITAGAEGIPPYASERFRCRFPPAHRKNSCSACGPRSGA